MKYLNKISDFLSKKFLVLVIMSTIVAFVFPSPFVALGKMRVAGQSFVTLGLGSIMFVMGMTINVEDFKIVLTRPKDMCIGALAQYTIMPLVAFALAKMFRLPADLAVGLVLLGTCPGGTASNVMTFLAKGDVAFSVGMTAVSTILSPIVTPVLTYALAGQWVEIDMVQLLIGIVQVVLVPIVLGIVVHKLLGEKLQEIKKAIVIFPTITILLVMCLCISPNRANLIHSGVVLVAAVCIHNWAGFFLGYVVGGFTHMNMAKKKALAIEVGLQNSALAVQLSAQFGNPLCALPAAVAIVIHQVSGSLLANIFSGSIALTNPNKKYKNTAKA